MNNGWSTGLCCKYKAFASDIQQIPVDMLQCDYMSAAEAKRN